METSTATATMALQLQLSRPSSLRRQQRRCLQLFLAQQVVVAGPELLSSAELCGKPLRALQVDDADAVE